MSGKDTLADAIIDFRAVAEGEEGFVKMMEDPDGKPDKYFPGNYFNFIVHYGPEIRILDFVSSSGIVEYFEGNSVPQFGSRKSTEQLTIGVEKNDYQLQYIPSGSLDFKWVILSNKPTVTVDGRELKFSSNTPACGEVSYQYICLMMRLKIPEVALAKGEKMRINIVVRYKVEKSEGD